VIAEQCASFCDCLQAACDFYHCCNGVHALPSATTLLLFGVVGVAKQTPCRFALHFNSLRNAIKVSHKKGNGDVSQ
jgi:hypothetical protein